MKVKPANEKMIIRDPATGLPIPGAGIDVAEHDSYWLRRLRDGDVVPVEPESEIRVSKTKEAK